MFLNGVLEKTLESPLDCKQIKPVNPKGNQSWIFIRRMDAEAPIMGPPDAKRWLIGKDPDARKDWGQEEKAVTKDEMVGCYHWLNGHQFSSVQFSCSVMSNSLWPHESQHARPPCPSPIPRVYPNSCPFTRWCYPTISSFVAPYSFCLQSFLASGSFPMSHLFASGGPIIGASASILLMNIQDWFPLGLTGWISLQSKGLIF